MTPNAEQIIRSKLDGWFFAVNPFSGEVKPRKVSKSFVPCYSEDAKSPRRTGGMNGKFKPFTSEMDDALIAARSELKSWDEMAPLLNRSSSYLRHRYFSLCTQRGITPICKVVIARMKT